MNSLIVAAAAVVGQFGFGDSDYNYRPTPRSSIYIRQNNYYVNNGDSLVDIETARRMRIDNWAYYARTRWAIQDEYQERERNRLSYLNSLERRIIAIERAQILTERYKELTGRNP